MLDNIAFILFVFSLPIAASFRIWRLTMALKQHRRVGRGVWAFFGASGYLLLLISLIVIWAAVILTFFFMETGSASGVPLGIALMVFPVVWGLSEILMVAGFIESDVDTANTLQKTPAK